MKYQATKSSYTGKQYYEMNKIYDFPGDPPNDHFEKIVDVEKEVPEPVKPHYGRGHKKEVTEDE